jgi:hypothetical protein
MKRFVASLLTILGLAGCQTTPKPSWDVLAPFGSTRVPPPGTTSYPAKGAYYNPNAPASTAPAGAVPTTGLPATPNTASPGISPQRPQAALPQDRTLASDGTWRTPNATASPGLGQLVPGTPTASQSTVVSAAFNVDMTAAMVTQTPVGTGVLPATGQVASKRGPKLNGMPVTDATQPAAAAEPAKFQLAPGATEISQLPRSTTTTAPNALSKEVISTAQASDQAKTSAPTAPAGNTASTLNWRTRPVATGAGN